MREYEFTSKIELAAADVLVVHCSDHRFQGALREFLDQTLGLKSNYDLLAVPGGPQCLRCFRKAKVAGWRPRSAVRARSNKHLVVVG
ncbi:MAG: hypothetical protein ACLQOO_02775 [Terriglobia bacterium]